jgi:beta-phosphoglucomutase
MMTTKLSAVLWDMDGVLVDTGEFHYQAWMSTLLEYDVAFSRKIFQKTFGMNNEGILRLLLEDRFCDELFREIDYKKEINFRASIRGKVEPLPGVLPLLKAIRTAGIPQAVASSAPPENIDTIIAEIGFQGFFQAVISATDMPGKPDPSAFLIAAREVAADPQACVVIEDAVSGVEAARRAGMKCVAVTTTNQASDLQNADLIVDRLDGITLDDLQALVRK